MKSGIVGMRHGIKTFFLFPFSFMYFIYRLIQIARYKRLSRIISREDLWNLVYRDIQFKKFPSHMNKVQQYSMMIQLFKKVIYEYREFRKSIR